MKQILLGSIFLSLFHLSPFANVFTFDGIGSWENAALWDSYPGTEIMANDTVIIMGICEISPSTIVLNEGAMQIVGALDVFGNLDNTGTITNEGYLDNVELLINNGTIINEGFFTNNAVFDNNAMFFNDGFFTSFDRILNFGTTYNTNIFENFESLRNEGVLENYMTFENYNLIENIQTIFVDSFAEFSNFNLLVNDTSGLVSNHGSVLNEGSIYNMGSFDNYGSLMNNDSIFHISDINNLGLLAGNGYSVSGDFYNFGILAPGDFTGIYTVEDKYRHGKTANLVISISGAAEDGPGIGFDQVAVGDSLLLDGLITVQIEDGYEPSLNESYTIILHNGFHGTFAMSNFADPGPGKGWDIVYGLNSVELVVVVSLPVTLIEFNAVRKGEKVILSWLANQSVDHDRYDLERKHGDNWTRIGSVNDRASVPADLIAYNFIDEKPEPGINIYRLKMIDLDGSFTYSPLRTVKMQSLTKQFVYPVPAEQYLFTSGTWEGDYQIVTPAGYTIKEGNLDDARIDISSIPAGVYFLVSGDVSQPFIKK